MNFTLSTSAIPKSERLSGSQIFISVFGHFYNMGEIGMSLESQSTIKISMAAK